LASESVVCIDICRKKSLAIHSHHLRGEFANQKQVYTRKYLDYNISGTFRRGKKLRTLHLVMYTKENSNTIETDMSITQHYHLKMKNGKIYF
jgi:hypothetical protein